MIKVIANDGSEFEGRDEVAVVRKMRAYQWNAPDLKRDYMDEVADRVRGMTGFAVRNDPIGFIADLETLGLVRIERQ